MIINIIINIGNISNNKMYKIMMNIIVYVYIFNIFYIFCNFNGMIFIYFFCFVVTEIPPAGRNFALKRNIVN